MREIITHVQHLCDDEYSTHSTFSFLTNMTEQQYNREPTMDVQEFIENNQDALMMHHASLENYLDDNWPDAFEAWMATEEAEQVAKEIMTDLYSEQLE